MSYTLHATKGKLWRRRLAGIMMGVALMGIGVSGMAVAQSETSGAESLTERLAERLLGYWGDPAVSRADILAGALPADLGVALPLPAGAELLGSVAHYERDRLVNVQAVLDAAAPAEEAFEDLREAFVAAGWIFVESFQSGGFVPAQATVSGQACLEDSGLFTYLSAASLPGGGSDVRLDLNLAAAAYNPPCEAASLTYRPEGQAPLPVLRAPEGTTLVPHSTMQMPDQASSTAVIATDMAFTNIVEHYADQLAEADWRSRSSRWDSTSAFAEWTFEDEEGVHWSGVFTAAVLPGDVLQHALGFYVVRAEGAP